MTSRTHTLRIATERDAARARILAARLTATATPADRLAFTAALSRRLRAALTGPETARLTFTADSEPPYAVHAALVGEGGDGDGDGDGDDGGGGEGGPLTCALTAPATPVAPSTDDETGTGLPDPERALLETDEDVEDVLSMLTWHRTELERTNQGVLALHAELAAATDAQRRLLAAESSARGRAETARRRLTFLAEAGATLGASLDPDEVLRNLTDLLVPAHAGTAQLWLRDEQGQLTCRTKTGPAGSGVPPQAAVAAAATGRPHHAAADAEPLDGVDHFPLDAAARNADPGRPLLAIPLTAGRTRLGVLTLTPSGDRFDPDDTVMLVEVARRAATSLDNALRYAHERNVAETLQQAMLSELPSLSGLRLAARYRPATQGMNIGGDWYDAFPQPDGSLIGVVGDVTGHGLRAAVTMGQLRNSLRAYAVEGHTPGPLLTLLHTLLRRLQPDLFATAVVARLEPETARVTWATAGHPPPLLRGPDGDVRILQPPSHGGAMLGLPLDQTVPEQTVTMPAGSTLLLYTDGLVERREHGVDPGIHRLAGALSRLGPLAGQDADAAAEALLDHMLRDHPGDDDVCMLLCHADSDTASVVPAGAGRTDRRIKADAPS